MSAGAFLQRGRFHSGRIACFVEGGEGLITRSDKEETVVKMKEKLGQAQSVVLADFRGITVKEFTGLRTLTRNADVEVVVAKNTLAKIALEQSGITGVDEYLNGTTVWAFSMSDPAAGAKILKDFSREHPRMVMKGGILDNKGFGPDMANTLADLPSREALLAQVAGMIQAPIAGLARVLQGPISKFGYVLEDYRKAADATV